MQAASQRKALYDRLEIAGADTSCRVGPCLRACNTSWQVFITALEAKAPNHGLHTVLVSKASRPGVDIAVVADEPTAK